MEGAEQPLPHADRIQAAFGRHDISSARSAIGGRAAVANEKMGSLAYTAGDRIAFRSEPDVKLSAHEAAHVAQQRSGAKLPGGVGRPGDAYERQADAVAEAVDRGESAEPLLDRTIDSGPSASSAVVQHQLEVNAVWQFEPPMLPPPFRRDRPRGARGEDRRGLPPLRPRSRVRARLRKPIKGRQSRHRRLSRRVPRAAPRRQAAPPPRSALLSSRHR